MNRILCLLLCLIGLSVKAGSPYLVNPSGVGTNISFDFRGSQTFRMFGPSGAGYFWAWGGAAFNTSSDRMVLAESNWPGIQLNFNHGLQLQNVSTVEMDFDAQTGNLTFQGTATGNGSGLTSLNGSQVTSGTVADARLSANVALLNRDPQTFSGQNIFPTVSATSLAVSGSVGLAGPAVFTNNVTMQSALTLTNGTLPPANLNWTTATSFVSNNAALKIPVWTNGGIVYNLILFTNAP